MRRTSFLVAALAAVAVAAEPISVTVPGDDGTMPAVTPAAAPAAAAAAAPAAAAPAADGGLTLRQKASYLFGYMHIGPAVKHYDLDEKVIYQALMDARDGKPSTVPVSEQGPVMGAWEQEIKSREAKGGEERKASNTTWLADNAKKDGVKVTASGLQYKILASGKGGSPSATDRVSVHYRGTLLDGSEFDSSYKRGEPATFGVNQVIKGWTEALQLMKEGDKWELYIPSELAYGEQGPPGIGANQVLRFEVELLKVLGGAGAP